MRNTIDIAVLALGFMALSPAADAATSWSCSNRLEDALPADAYYVPPERATDIAQLLTTHHRLRLAPGADYRRATGVTLHSGEALYGAAGTRMGRLVVAPGTSGAIVSGVAPEALEFPPSALPTHGNCFEKFAARTFPQQALRLVGAVIEDNLFLDAAQVLIDDSSSGRVQGNRFIRVLVHGESPAIRVEGKPGHASDRNIFLWTNVLGAEGDGIVVRDQREISFIGIDAENWNQRRLARFPAMMSVSNSGTVRALMAHGGDPKTPPGQYLDIAAERLELLGMRLLRAATPAVVLHAGMQQYVEVLATLAGAGGDAAISGDAAVATRLIADRDASTAISYRGEPGLPPAPEPARTPWPAPVFARIADPAGPDWRRRRATAPDSRATLQALIDTQGLVSLPAGVYYLSAPLRLRNGQGLIGAGAGRTAIVAKRSDIDLIVGDDHYADKHATSFSLIDITLQGGRAGLRHDERGAGAGAQFNLCHLSHVVFRDLSEAGIVLEGIYGWDNNLLDNLSFYNLPIGVLQAPSTWYRDPAINGDVAGMNYFDKNVCYRCRFERVDRGLQLTARRANGLNACIDCRFERNRLGALRLVNNLSTIIANSDFIDNGGDPVIQSNFPVGLVSARFVTGAREHALLDSGAICEGCRMVRAGAAKPSIATGGARVALLDSYAPGFLPGNNVAGLLLETDLGGDGAYQGRLVALNDGQPTILAGGKPQAQPQWLVSWND